MRAQKVFFEILNKYLKNAQICFCIGQEKITVGSGDSCEITICVHNQRFFNRILSYGNLGMAEAYMDKDFSFGNGTLERFLEILLEHQLEDKIKNNMLLAIKVLGIQTLNLWHRNKRNVQRHYDIGDDLFESFLDKTLTYSCGYVKDVNDGLEQLQFNKLERICQKLQLQKGEKLLDIGCGYGGLLIHAAQHYGVEGLGVTISKHHCKEGNARIQKNNLGDKIKIEFHNHRHIKGTFDKFVSVGMMEHLPRREYKHFFSTICHALNPQGIGLLHAIGCNTFRNDHDPFTQKYIFPGSGQPRLSEMTTGLEENRLAILDVENMIRHYTMTLIGWLERFQQNKDKLDTNKYDETFMRMWEYYLSCCIAFSKKGTSALYQVLFTKDYSFSLPFQRV